MKKFLFISVFALAGCSIDMIQIDTHGPAEDVVDNTSSQQVDPQTTLSVPLTGT